MLQRSARLAIGGLLVVAGLIMMPMPIPLGLLFILLGLSLLISVLPALRLRILALRQRFPKWSRSLQRQKRYLPAALRHLLDDTDPEQHP